MSLRLYFRRSGSEFLSLSCCFYMTVCYHRSRYEKGQAKRTDVCDNCSSQVAHSDFRRLKSSPKEMIAPSSVLNSLSAGTLILVAKRLEYMASHDKDLAPISQLVIATDWLSGPTGFLWFGSKAAPPFLGLPPHLYMLHVCAHYGMSHMISLFLLSSLFTWQTLKSLKVYLFMGL